MTNKRIIAIVIAIIVLFLGIFAFAQEEEPKNNNNNENKDIIEEENEIGEEEEGDEEEQLVVRVSRDTIAPKIVLNGGDISIDLGETYEELGATVTDNRDADKPAIVNGDVNVNVAGVYKITYTGSDSAGNNATPIVRTVTVKPLISGISEYTHEVGNPIPTIEMDVTLVMGEAPIKITSDSDIKWNIAGQYDMVFKYTTTDGATAEKVVKIIVQDTKKPWVTYDNNGNWPTYKRWDSTIVSVNDKGVLDSSTFRYLWLPFDTLRPSEADFNENGKKFKNFDRIYTPWNVTGKYRLWILAKDNQGNTKIEKSRIFLLDNTKPFTPFVDFNGQESCEWTNENVVIDLYAGDIGSGSVRYQYKKGNDSWKNLYPYGNNQLIISNNYVNTSYKFRAIDLVGLKSNQTFAYCVKIDKIKPNIHIYSDSERVLYKNNHNVSISVSDFHSGIKEVKYLWSLNSTGITSDQITNDVSLTNGFALIPGNNNMTGTYYLWVLAVDEAGNEKIVKSDLYQFDNANPFIVSVANSSGEWNNDDVLLTINADANTGIIDGYIINGVYQESNEVLVTQTSTIIIVVKDTAGNESLPYTVNVNIDRINPTIEVANPYLPNSETKRIEVEKREYSKLEMESFVIGSDTGGSGVSHITFEGQNSNEGYTFNTTGPTSVKYTIYDNAGNSNDLIVYFNVKAIEITLISNNGYYKDIWSWSKLKFESTYIGRQVSVSINAGGYDSDARINYIWKRTEEGAPTDLEWLASYVWSSTTNPLTINQNFVLNEYIIYDLAALHLDGALGSRQWTLWVMVDGKVVSQNFTIE